MSINVCNCCEPIPLCCGPENVNISFTSTEIPGAPFSGTIPSIYREEREGGCWYSGSEYGLCYEGGYYEDDIWFVQLEYNSVTELWSALWGSVCWLTYYSSNSPTSTDPCNPSGIYTDGSSSTLTITIIEE